jgi:hypothetical protein
METMFNPFLEGKEIETTQVAYILDKALHNSKDQQNVFQFFKYLVVRKNTEEYNELVNEMIKMIGIENFKLIENTYLNTYDLNTGTFSRYAYFDNRNDIRSIYNSFIIINQNINVLRAIAYKYNKK